MKLSGSRVGYFTSSTPYSSLSPNSLQTKEKESVFKSSEGVKLQSVPVSQQLDEDHGVVVEQLLGFRGGHLRRRGRQLGRDQRALQGIALVVEQLEGQAGGVQQVQEGRLLRCCCVHNRSRSDGRGHPESRIPYPNNGPKSDRAMKWTEMDKIVVPSGADGSTLQRHIRSDHFFSAPSSLSKPQT